MTESSKQKETLTLDPEQSVLSFFSDIAAYMSRNKTDTVTLAIRTDSAVLTRFTITAEKA